MPSLTAFVVATLMAWIVRGALPAPEGMPLPLLIAGVVWLVAFYFVRRWLAELRPDV
jgi:hypothetical protein